MTARPEVKLVAVGDNCLDVYLTEGIVAVGGNALNVAVQWRRNGWPARYIGAVGNDSEGDIVLAEVAAAGLAPGDVERISGGTGVTLLTREHGDRSFLLEILGVGEGYQPPPATYAEIADADWVHLGTNASPTLVRALVDDRIPFSVDISTKHGSLPLDGVPLLFASGPKHDETRILALLRELRRADSRQVVLTCGERGAYFDDGYDVLHVPALPTTVTDTCGAGDSFIATFLTALRCEALGPAESLHRAARAAAETCTHLGGFPQQERPIPRWLLDKHAQFFRGTKGN